MSKKNPPDFSVSKCHGCLYFEWGSGYFDDDGNVEITGSCGGYPDCVDDRDDEND